ncbi:MAG: transporter [Flavisolibacter sp.]|nr:transporter [Flavisolibacter sp.]
MKRITTFLAAFLMLTAASAQEKMETDRPGETQTPTITKKGYFQVETGIRREQYEDKDHLVRHPQAYLKFGLLDRLELRAEVTAETQKFYTEGDVRRGLKPVELGLKTKLLGGKGWIPAASLYTMIGIPRLASEEHKAEHAFSRLRLLFENKLSDKVSLNYNLGAEWEGEEGEHPQWLYTYSPQIEITDKLGAFIESYGFLQKEKRPEHVLDGGFLFDVSNNVRLDVSGGVGLSDAAPKYFVAGGFSFRIKP